MAEGSSGFHEKACRGFSLKRSTFFLELDWGLGLAAFPMRSGFHTHSGGGVNGRAVPGGIQGASEGAALLGLKGVIVNFIFFAQQCYSAKLDFEGMRG